jgi:hypothetical protein
VKKRLEDDFSLKIGSGEDVPEMESEVDFLNRTILQLRRADVNDVIKLFNRVEKNNRKAVSNDMAFQAQREVYKKKVAEDDAEEKLDDDEHSTFHRGSPEEYAEFEDWCQQFEYRDGEKDFTAFANSDVTRGSKVTHDDGTFAGYDLVEIRAALHYFQSNSKPADEGTSQDCPPPAAEANATKTETPPFKTTRPDANVIKAELAKWSPASVVSSYRRLSLIKHPDKEGGSPEAFQELHDHARVLTEAVAKFHGVTVKKGLSKKKNTSAPKGGAKVAICAEIPENLKRAVMFFEIGEDKFRCHNIIEIKKVRQLLSAQKEWRDKQIQKEKEPEKLLEILRAGTSSDDQEGEEANDLSGKNLKQLKTLCSNMCKAHYASVYGHIQKMK